MNRNKMLLAAGAALSLIGAARATGTADTDISAGVDNAVATWGYTKTALLGIGVFLICYGLFKRLRRA